MHYGIVDNHHWVSGRQFLDAVAIGLDLTGPGRDHGELRRLPRRRAWARSCHRRDFSCRVTSSSSCPVVWSALPEAPTRAGFVEGATARLRAAIAGASYVLARGAITDTWTIVIYLAALGVLVRSKSTSPTSCRGGLRRALPSPEGDRVIVSCVPSLSPPSQRQRFLVWILKP